MACAKWPAGNSEHRDHFDLDVAVATLVGHEDGPNEQLRHAVAGGSGWASDVLGRKDANDKASGLIILETVPSLHMRDIFLLRSSW